MLHVEAEGVLAMAGVIGFAAFNENTPGRMVLEGAEAGRLNALLRPTPETLESLRQIDEAFALGALQCRNILVG